MSRHFGRKVLFHYLPSFVMAIVLSTMGTIESDETSFNWWSSAYANESGHSGGHKGGRGGGHDSGHTDHDSDEGDDHGSSGHSSGRKGYGSRGGGHSHDIARGGGKAVESRIFSGRRPVWAQEGIPEVELGRLNVSRAPGRVLARAEDEALATYLEEMATLYNLSADAAASLLESNFRGVSRYDSPLQNLALYKDVMIFGDTQLRGIDSSVVPASQLDLAAIFLGSASDKTIPISEDTVTALNRILGLIELSSDDRNILATKAETVRQAILIGHGPTEEH